ncbi:MAG: serine/threonine-protein kinase, partial [Planctomycetota bacterium]
MTAKDPCLDTESLKKILAGQLDSAEVVSMCKDLANCKPCQRKLLEIESGFEWRNQLLGLDVDVPDSKELEQAMTRVRQFVAVSLGEKALSLSKAEFEIEIDHAALLRDGYELVSRIGHGATGVVYRAREPALERHVALKFLLPELANQPLARERFLREAKAAASVIHSNLVTIHSVSDKEPMPYIVMEYVSGSSLQERLDSGKRMNLVSAIRIGSQIAAGLGAAHDKGIVHRDIKPANILINSESNKIQISDFGLARAADNSRLTKSGILVGTPAYVAPETLQDSELADHRADLFSLGVVLYALCSGDSPFHADSLLGTLRRLAIEIPPPLKEKREDIPDWLSDAIDRLLDKDPNARYQSASEVRQILREGIKKLPVANTEPTNQKKTVSEFSKSTHVAMAVNLPSEIDKKSLSSWLPFGLGVKMAIAALGVISLSIAAVLFWPNSSVQSNANSAEQDTDLSINGDILLPELNGSRIDEDERIDTRMGAEASPFL